MPSSPTSLRSPPPRSWCPASMSRGEGGGGGGIRQRPSVWGSAPGGGGGGRPFSVPHGAVLNSGMGRPYRSGGYSSATAFGALLHLHRFEAVGGLPTGIFVSHLLRQKGTSGFVGPDEPIFFLRFVPTAACAHVPWPRIPSEVPSRLSTCTGWHFRAYALLGLCGNEESTSHFPRSGGNVFSG